MPSDKFKTMSSVRSVRNAANNFFTTFSVNPYGKVLSSSSGTMDETPLNEYIDKRSAHNALERQRRENLNSKFQQLAHALPSLQSVRRPSKTVIVTKSLEFVSRSADREHNFQAEIERLRRENERLRRQAEKSKIKLPVSNTQEERKQDKVCSPPAPRPSTTTSTTTTSTTATSTTTASITQGQQQQRQQQPELASTDSGTVKPKPQKIDHVTTTLGAAPPLDHNTLYTAAPMFIMNTPLAYSAEPVQVTTTTATTTAMSPTMYGPMWMVQSPTHGNFTNLTDMIPLQQQTLPIDIGFDVVHEDYYYYPHEPIYPPPYSTQEDRDNKPSGFPLGQDQQNPILPFY